MSYQTEAEPLDISRLPEVPLVGTDISEAALLDFVTTLNSSGCRFIQFEANELAVIRGLLSTAVRLWPHGMRH